MQLSSTISTRLHYQHKALVDLIEGFSDEQIRRQVIPGKWSVFEHIVHLQTYQHFFAGRIRLILEQDNPVFHAYTAEADPLFLDNCHITSREVIHDLFSLRKDINGDLTAFPADHFIRTAVHPVYGKMNLTQWIEFFLLHEAHHLYTIFKICSELRKEIDSAK